MKMKVIFKVETRSVSVNPRGFYQIKICQCGNWKSGSLFDEVKDRRPPDFSTENWYPESCSAPKHTRSSSSVKKELCLTDRMSAGVASVEVRLDVGDVQG